MSPASVPSPFRFPPGCRDRLRGHGRPVLSAGGHRVGQPFDVIASKTVLAVMGAPALLSEPGGGHDDLADRQERLELEKGGQLVVVTRSLVRDPDLAVARRQLPDLA